MPIDPDKAAVLPATGFPRVLRHAIHFRALSEKPTEINPDIDCNRGSTGSP
jgi:hypothetical protein